MTSRRYRLHEHPNRRPRPQRQGLDCIAGDSRQDSGARADIDPDQDGLTGIFSELHDGTFQGVSDAQTARWLSSQNDVAGEKLYA